MFHGLVPKEGRKCFLWTDNTLLALAASYRIVILLVICTTFVPDEYFQYAEPSFAVLAKQGIRTWEWESEHRIRSYLPLLPLISGYKLLSLLGMDNESNLQILPRLLFTILAVCSDYHFLRLCKFVLAPETKPTENAKCDTLSAHQCAFIVHVLSWSASYCLPRTLGNSLETTLLIIGTSLLFTTSTLDRKQKDNVSSAAIVLAAVSVYCRPTAVLLWVPLFLLKAATLKRPLEPLIFQAIPISVTVLQCAILLDTYLYSNQFTIAPLRFYTANVTKGYATLFGVRAWYWGLTQALPTMLGIYAPLVVVSICTKSINTTTRLLAMISIFYTVGLPFFSPHLEIRFLLPTLPFLHILCGLVLQDMIQYGWSVDTAQSSLASVRKQYWCRNAIIFAFVAQFMGVLYLISFHQLVYQGVFPCGAERAVSFVGQDLLHQHTTLINNNSTPHRVHTEANIYYAASCYTFPGYAGLHLPFHTFDGYHNHSGSKKKRKDKLAVKIHASPCYLNMTTEDYFDHNPLEHFNALLTKQLIRTVDKEQYDRDRKVGDNDSDYGQRQSIDYVLTFDSYVVALHSVLKLYNYEQVAEYSHAYFRYDLDDPHPKQNVLVFKRIN